MCSIGEPGTVIDGHVQILPTQFAAAAGAITMDAMARLPDAAETLGIDVDEVTGMSMFIQVGRRHGIEPGQPVQSDPSQHQAHSGRGHAQHPGDHRIGQPLPSHRFHLRQPSWRQPVRTAMRRRTAIIQALSPDRYRRRQRHAICRDTPVASAAAPTGTPLSIRSIIRTRPRGVRRAFLWTFIRGFRPELELRNPSLSPMLRVNSLHSNDS